MIVEWGMFERYHHHHHQKGPSRYVNNKQRVKHELLQFIIRHKEHTFLANSRLQHPIIRQQRDIRIRKRHRAARAHPRQNNVFVRLLAVVRLAGILERAARLGRRTRGIRGPEGGPPTGAGVLERVGGVLLGRVVVVAEELERLAFRPDVAAGCPVELRDELVQFERIVDESVGSFEL